MGAETMKKRALVAAAIVAIVGLPVSACGRGEAVPAAPPAEGERATWDDGQWIAFVSGRDGNPEIYKMRADGSQVMGVTNDPAWERGPSWSPDGNWIAFESRLEATSASPLGNEEIFKVAHDGSQLTNLTDNPASDSDPSWSPDANWIALVSDRDGNFEIYKMRADGSQVTRLTNDPAWDRSPAWSPDGQWIAFGSRQDGEDSVYSMRVDGSEVTRLAGSAIADHTCWSPDGQWIAFISFRDASWTEGGTTYVEGEWNLYKVRTDGSDLTRLTESSSADCQPTVISESATDLSWSPDGEWIAFVSWCGGYTDEIFKVKTDGSGITRLTHNPPLVGRPETGRDYSPAWTP